MKSVFAWMKRKAAWCKAKYDKDPRVRYVLKEILAAIAAAAAKRFGRKETL